MVEVRYKARLGNNLFQYCLARIIAERLGYALVASPVDGFPNTTQRVDGAHHSSPEQVLSGQRIDLDAILTDRRPRRIVLDGWFQRYEYYRPHRDQIRDWLRFDPAIAAPPAAPDVVLHVRRLDYVQLGWALPFGFYDEALRRLRPAGDVWILTDDVHDPFFRRFAEWRPKFARGTALEALRLMTAARRMVMSQSTFSWWPTFLGDPETVVCPEPSFGGWSATGEASDSMLIERDRFVCLPVTQTGAPTPAEARYQTRRLLKRRMILAVNRRLGTQFAVPPP